jgi:SagB-type dehydrogenase family enzyme
MSQTPWGKYRIPGKEMVWQLYHENSKSSRFRLLLTGQDLIDWQLSLQPSLCYEGHPIINLPRPQPTFGKPLEQVLLERRTASDLVKTVLPVSVLATLLYYAYGISSPSLKGSFPHGTRAVPSGGALYPLELYVHVSAVEGVPAGIYHYEPATHLIRRFADGDQSEKLAACLVQPDLAMHAAFMVFITSLFARTTTKYGERGYRFALLEAGHVGQNLALVASALGLGITGIGGFIDFRVDRLLDIDGVNQSSLYLFAVGGSKI